MEGREPKIAFIGIIGKKVNLMILLCLFRIHQSY
jgi:hypothetical protein